MSIVDKIKELTANKALTMAELERTLGLGAGTVSRWDLRTPGVDKVEKVANYFNVSVDYLLGRTDNPNMVNEEPTLLAAHIDNNLSEEEMEEVLQYIEFLRSKHKK